MKPCFLAAEAMVIVSAFISTTYAGTMGLQDVNELCHEMPCEKGLYCVTIMSGEKKCSTCDQGKLGRFTDKVRNFCKRFGEGWTPGKDPAYQATEASDGRHFYDVLDPMIDSARSCLNARVAREKECWSGGDDEHKKAIRDNREAVKNAINHKKKQVGGRRIYYGSARTYPGNLRHFNSECEVDSNNPNQRFDQINNDLDENYLNQDRGKTVSCLAIEKHRDFTEKCYQAALVFRDREFKGDDSKFPPEYGNILKRAQDTRAMAVSLLHNIKQKSLCE